MANLINHLDYARQPSQARRILKAHPLAKGLVGSFTPIDPGRVVGTPAYINGNISVRTGKEGLSWRGGYQASNNYVAVPYSNAYGGTDQVSFEALIKAYSFQTTVFPYISGIISQYGYGAPGPILRFNNDATIGNAAKATFFVTESFTEYSATSPTDLNINTIYHLMGTYDGSNVHLYIDGVLVASTSVSGAITRSAIDIAIGSDYVYEPVYSQNRCFDGDIYLARVYSVAKTANEVRLLAENPWRLFAQDYRQNYLSFNATSGTSVALTSSVSTFAQGSLSIAIDKSISGSSIPTQIGTMIATPSYSLTGLANTSGNGSLGISADKELTGISVTGQSDTMTATPSLGISGASSSIENGTILPEFEKSLAGIALLVSDGSLSPEATVSISGVAITGSTGTLTPVVDSEINVALTGIEITASAGSFVVEVLKALTGSEATSASGTVTPAFETIVQLTGISISMSAGSLGVTSANDLLNSVATVAQQGLIADVSDAITGSSSTLSLGNVTAAVDGILTSNLLSLGQGNVSVSIDVNLLGIQATIYLGTLTPRIIGDIDTASIEWVIVEAQSKNIIASSLPDNIIAEVFGKNIIV